MSGLFGMDRWLLGSALLREGRSAVAEWLFSTRARPDLSERETLPRCIVAIGRKKMQLLLDRMGILSKLDSDAADRRHGTSRFVFFLFYCFSLPFLPHILPLAGLHFSSLPSDVKRKSA